MFDENQKLIVNQSMGMKNKWKEERTSEVGTKCMTAAIKLFKSCKRLRKDEKHQEYLEYSCGESDEEISDRFSLMNEEERAERVADLWRTMLAKSRGAVRILNKLSDLNRHIYLHGSTRKKEDVEMQDKIKPLKIVLMPDSDLISYWNVIMMLLLLYTATYVPFKTAFV